MLKINRCLGVIIVIVTSFFLIQSGTAYAENKPLTSSESSSQTLGNLDNVGGGKSKLNDNENTNKKSVSEAVAEDTGIDKKVAQGYLDKQDMDNINDKLLFNYKPYHKDAKAFDFSTNAAHVLSDLFSSINRDIVYGVFDKALSLLFNLTNVQNSTNALFKATSSYNKAFWNNKAFKQLVYLAFSIGILWAFIKQVRDRGGFKVIVLIIAYLIFGSAWIAGGGTVLEKVNNMTSTAEVVAFQATSSTDNPIQTDNFQSAIRYQYFNQAIARPFYLVNFNKTENKDINTKKMGDPIDFIRGAVATSDDVPDKNPNMTEDGKRSWYQVMVSLVSPATSTFYGIPLFFIGLFNIALQFGSVAIYFFAPFAVLISLFPKYARSGIKTAIGAVFLLFAKIFLIFGIVLLNWVQGFTDKLIPVTDSGSVILNAALYITLMMLLWKNKGRIFAALTGSGVVGRMADKAHVRQPYEEMKRSAKNAKDSVVNGRRRVQKAKGNYRKTKKWAKEKFGDGEKEPETNPTNRRFIDLDEARKNSETRRLARQQLLDGIASLDEQPNDNGKNGNSKKRSIFGGQGNSNGSEDKDHQKRQAARSFVLQRKEYTGNNIERDEGNKGRTRTTRTHGV